MFRNIALWPSRAHFALFPIILLLPIFSSDRVFSRPEPTPSAQPRFRPFGKVIPESFFGMIQISRDSAIDVPAITALGKGTFVDWPYLEPRRGAFDWESLDKWVGYAELRKADFTYSFGGIPEWAASDKRFCAASAQPDIRRCQSSPIDLRDARDFAEALARRYRGRIQYYELWNEPEYTFGMSPSEMALLSHAIYQSIRNEDPNAKIISVSLNGLHPEYADAYFSSGGVRDVDIVSIHSYPSLRDNNPEAIDRNYIGPAPLLSPLISILKKYGLDAKPLWVTETSWSDRKDDKNFDQKMAFVSRALLLDWSNGIDRVYWYAWDHTWLGRLKGTPTGQAYSETERWMVGSIMNRPCQPQQYDRYLWTCELINPRGHRSFVAWRTSGEAVLSLPREFNRSEDLSGRSQAVDGGNFVVGEKPILISASAGDAVAY